MSGVTIKISGANEKWYGHAYDAGLVQKVSGGTHDSPSEAFTSVVDECRAKGFGVTGIEFEYVPPPVRTTVVREASLGLVISQRIKALTMFAEPKDSHSLRIITSEMRKIMDLCEILGEDLGVDFDE